MMPLLLLRPKILSLKNRMRGNYNLRTQFGRDLVIFFFSLGLLYAIHLGTSEALGVIKAHTNMAYLPPSLPLGLLFLMLLVMLLLSNAVAALGAFYHGRDLDLLMAAPLTPGALFWGKFSEVLFGSSWMALVFALPAVLAFGQQYNAGVIYYFIALLSLLPYFVVPSAISTVLVTIASRFLPVHRTREIIMLLGLMCVGVVYMVFRLIEPSASNFQDVNELLRLLALLSLPQTIWSPSYWTATCMGEFLAPSGKPWGLFLILLYSFAGALVALSYLSIRLLHSDAYSMSRSIKQNLRLKSKAAQQRLRLLTPFLSSPYRALFGKEVKTFTRDITQTLQLLLLLALCLIYLYNFRILHAVKDLPSNTQAYWQAFLIFSNVGMGAFVITAVCSRFVFPSISLEGQAFWILQTSPLNLSDVLRARFWCWFVPVGIMSSVIFCSGALAIDAPTQIVVVNIIASWIICYGIVGMAVGLGALFANFEWESASQLSASFGSLVFMVLSSFLICVSMIPIAILIFLRTLKNFGYDITPLEWYLCVGTSSLLLIWINHAAVRWALKTGENALSGRMS